MLTSMTGFASVSASLKLSSLDNVQVTVDLKTLNSRFFEVVAKLPVALSQLEIPMTRMLQEGLVRGRVFLTIRSGGQPAVATGRAGDQNGQGLERIVPSVASAQSYHQAALTIASACGLAPDISLQALLGLPGVLVQETCQFTPADEQAILDVLKQAIDQVTATRVTEGQTLERDFARIFGVCQEKIVHIKQAFDELETRYKHELASIVPAEGQTELGDDAKAKRTDLMTLLNKIDIHEEITRFNSHLASAQKLLGAQQLEKGKRFDFVLQELLRETNTIMSKCNNYQISALGIDVKVELEKAREQIQNIV